jgi:hypothetical protein
MKAVTMMKTKELVDEYNQLTGDVITKFPNRETAESKVMEARKSVRKEPTVEKKQKEPAVQVEKKQIVASTIDDVSKMFRDLIEAQTEADHLNNQLIEAKKLVEAYSLEFKTINDIIQELKGKILPSALKQFGVGVKQTRTAKTRAPKEHLKVEVNGTVYRSVAAAFKALELPVEDVIKVRKVLKETGQYTYEGTAFKVVKE